MSHSILNSRNYNILFIANIILCIGSIIGLILWQIKTYFYTLASIYGFNWFVTITCLLLGILFFVGFKFKKNVILAKELFLTYVLLFISFLFSIFWLSIASTESSYTRDCLYFNNLYGGDYGDGDYYDYNDFSCSGLIVSMIFSWLLFVTWVIIFGLTGYHIYNKYRENNSQWFPRNNTEMLPNSTVPSYTTQNQQNAPTQHNTHNQYTPYITHNTSTQRDTSTQHVPTQHVPTQHVPTQHVPTQHVSTQHVSTQQTPNQYDTSTQQTPTQHDTFTQQTPTQHDTSTQQTPIQHDTSTQNVSTDKNDNGLENKYLSPNSIRSKDKTDNISNKAVYTDSENSDLREVMIGN